ncbi:MAG: TerB family tellurite resistance protein [Deltaproteobacteria bacterium]|nr:MAG: TerB family tellurite resistance protein [Deltaproteobacteria bacterium]
MPRVDDYLNLVDDPKRQGFTPGHPADDALIALLAHMAFSDGEVHDRELDFLQRILPGRDASDLRMWAMAAGARPLDLSAVAAALPSAEEAWKGLRFAARMAWKDGMIADAEVELLTRLAAALNLPEAAVQRVLDETEGHVITEVTAEKVKNTMLALNWDAVQLATGPLASDLKEIVPEGYESVVRVGLEKVEVLGIFAEGVAGRFLEGNTFLHWQDIVTYSRVPVIGASVQIHTETGRTWSLVDTRLRGLGRLFDRLFAIEREAAEVSNAPVVTPVRLHED